MTSSPSAPSCQTSLTCIYIVPLSGRCTTYMDCVGILLLLMVDNDKHDVCIVGTNQTGIIK